MNNFTREQLLEVFNHLTRDEVKSILENNGINSEYLEDTDNEVIGGTEEWMDVIEEITGKDPYNDTMGEEESKVINKFIDIMENELNIQLN